MPDLVPPFAQELDPATTYAVRVVSSSQLVRVGVEGMKHCVPVRIARMDTVLPLGGETLFPGDAVDMQGLFFLRTPAGPRAFVWCENRTIAGGRYVDPFGVLRAQMTWKPAWRDLEPGVWATIVTNVQGMNGMTIKVTGGRAWIGTHLNTTVPPMQSDPNVQGVPWPLDPGDAPLTIRGNPALLAYAYDPGVRLWYTREQNAWDF